LRGVIQKYLRLIAFILTWSIPSYGEIYYVSTTGSDAHSCGQSQRLATAKKTISAGVSCPAAGDTLYVKGGTYNERLVLDQSGDAREGYLTISNVPGETPVLDGAGLGNGDMIHGTKLSYVRIRGFHITNHIGAGIVLQGGGSHVEIRDNEISNQTFEKSNGHGILIDAREWPGPIYHTYTDIIIDGNHLHDIVTGVPSGYNEALTLVTEVSRFQVTNNVIDHASFIGIDLIGWGDSYPSRGIIAHNIVRNSGFDPTTTAIYLDGAKDVVIEHNKVYNNNGHGFVVSNETANLDTENIILRFNESWDNLRNYSPAATGPGISRHVRVIHNVAVGTGAQTKSGYGPRNFVIYRGEDVVIKNNISVNVADNFHVEHYYPTALSFSAMLDYNGYSSAGLFQYQNISYPNFAAYRQATGLDQHSIIGDPLFVDLAGRDFRLRLLSPAIDAGDFLTRASAAGSGAVIRVEDAHYFFDGYGIVEGDLIQIGSNAAVRVLAIDYAINTITIDQNLSWNAGDGVSYPYSGSKPNMGAYEKPCLECLGD
jgi:parallel beta-helix repeat protein